MGRFKGVKFLSASEFRTYYILGWKGNGSVHLINKIDATDKVWVCQEFWGCWLPMFNADNCVQPASICKMFASLCLHPWWQQWKLLSWDQFPPVPSACWNANVPSRLPGLGGQGSMCQEAASARLGSAPSWPRRICPDSCSAPMGARRFRLGGKELAP